MKLYVSIFAIFIVAICTMISTIDAEEVCVCPACPNQASRRLDTESTGRRQDALNAGRRLKSEAVRRREDYVACIEPNCPRGK